MERTKPIIGLCGGIGSGKSTVASLFESMGCRIINSDRLNAEVMERPEVRERLRAWWGDGVIEADGSVNREYLADLVFDRPEERRRLESLVHPLIGRLREDMIIESIRDRKVKAIILDSPLLFESGLDTRCDAVVFVEADEATRLGRLRKARGWDGGELRRRERWQDSLDSKRSRADYVVCNDGSLQQLRPRIGTILEEITTRFKSQ
jgi:dephospho-CoA kinase